MTPINAMLLSTISFNGLQPTLVDEVDDSLLYIGYCMPNCTGPDDDKWLIKRVQKKGTVQSIYWSNGNKVFNQKWNDRATIQYKMTEWCDKKKDDTEEL